MDNLGKTEESVISFNTSIGSRKYRNVKNYNTKNCEILHYDTLNTVRNQITISNMEYGVTLNTNGIL